MSHNLCPADTCGARIEAVFSRVRGGTQISHSYCSAPLKIARAFPLDGGQIGVCVMDSSPGLLAGDNYSFDWRLNPGARVFLTNQSFTKVHPSLHAPCRQTQRIEIAGGASLEYFPEPVMLFRDAALLSDCHVNIERGGTLLMSDILCAGRTSRGEIFEFERWQNRLHVHYDGELIFCNQTLLQPRRHAPQRHGAWGDSTYLGNLYIFCDSLSPARASDLVLQLRQVLESHPDVRGGASLLEKHGLAVSMLGSRAWDLQQATQSLRICARSFL